MDEKGVRQLYYKLSIVPEPAVTSKGWLHASCPFAAWTHKSGTDNSPSFGVRIENNGASHYFCFSCKAKGRLAQLVRVLERLRGEDLGSLATDTDLLEAQVKLPEYDNAQISDRQVSPPIDEARFDVFDAISEHADAAEYLHGRVPDICDDVVAKVGLKYDPDTRRILFPVRDLWGQLYGYTGRSILSDDERVAPDGGRYPKIKNYFGLQKEHHVLGAHLYTPGLPWLVVEGLFGYLNVVSRANGRYNAACIMGSHLSSSQSNFFKACGDSVILMLDNDEAGEIGLFGGNGDVGAVDKLIDDLVVIVPAWPDGKDDPDQLDDYDIDRILQTPPYSLF